MLRHLLAALLAMAPLARSHGETPFTAAIQEGRVGLTASGNGRDTLHLQFTAVEKTKVEVPAGFQFRSESGEAQMTLRSVTVEPGPAAAVDAIVPAAALKSTNTASERKVLPAGPADPSLGKLLEFFAQQNDLPRPTAQLAVFIALEDIPWAAWKQWMQPIWSRDAANKAHPTPAEVAQAVDAIAFARLAFPDRKFSILENGELKRLALRNPWARGKAMALYGLTVEDAITGDSSLPVDLGKLLHTSPNDNCAICRQRDKGPGDIP